MNAGSKGNTEIPSDPHRMVSATCPAVAPSGRLMIMWKCIQSLRLKKERGITYSMMPGSGSETVQGRPTLLWAGRSPLESWRELTREEMLGTWMVERSVLTIEAGVFLYSWNIHNRLKQTPLPFFLPPPSKLSLSLLPLFEVWEPIAEPETIAPLLTDHDHKVSSFVFDHHLQTAVAIQQRKIRMD